MERTGLRHETLTVTMELPVPTDTPFSSPNRDWGLRRRMETVWVFPTKRASRDRGLHRASPEAL